MSENKIISKIKEINKAIETEANKIVEFIFDEKEDTTNNIFFEKVKEYKIKDFLQIKGGNHKVIDEEGVGIYIFTAENKIRKKQVFDDVKYGSKVNSNNNQNLQNIGKKTYSVFR